MKSGRIKKYLKTEMELKLFEKKLEFWKLKSWKLNLKIGILKNYLRMEFFFKLNLKIRILEIYLKMRDLKIKFES